MALDAFPHAPVLIRQPLHVLDFSVTFPAGNAGVDMALMIEKYMLGYIIHLNPGGWGLRVEIRVLFLDLRVLLNDIIVTVQAFFHWGYARKMWVGDVGVAVLALYLFYAAVYIMAEGDRLFRAETP